MRRFLERRWFLIALVALIGGGMAIGESVPKVELDRILSGGDTFAQRILRSGPSLITPLVLFLMAFTLDGRHLRAALRAPGPVLWGSLVNAGVLPLLAWPLLSLQRTTDFRYGLMVAAAVPCTIAAASVWTRKAKGNDAVSLMITLLTNGLCFAVVPFWLEVATGSGVNLDAPRMMLSLIATVLVPTVLGQALRWIPFCEAFAVRAKTPLGVAAQSLILSMVLLAAVKAGSRLVETGDGPGPDAAAIAIVWTACLAVHLVGMAIGWFGAKALGIARPDAVAIAFASSQKTLPVGILITSDPTMLGNPDLLGPGLGVPFAIFPMLMFHATQLFVDDALADRFAAGAPPPGA